MVDIIYVINVKKKSMLVQVLFIYLVWEGIVVILMIQLKAYLNIA